MSRPRLVTMASYIEFVERVIPRDVAGLLAGPLAEAHRRDEHTGRSLGRLLRQHTRGGSG